MRFTKLNDQLEPRAYPCSNGTLRFHGGKLIEGSQGIVIMEVASMAKANLQKVHCYTRDCSSAPKNKAFVSAPHMPNTATCWAVADTESVASSHGATDVERLETSIGGLVLPHFDLLLAAADKVGDEDSAISCALGIMDHEVPHRTAAAKATAQLQNHLLRACAMDAPAMYALQP